MTKEQEKAIEILEDIKNNTWTTKYIMSSDSKKAETVLNMLKEKDKEIEKLKADNKKAWKLNANMTQRHLSDIFKIKKKDKQIDLMATTLSAICTGLSTVRDHFEKEYCEFINSDKDCCWKTDTSCKDCIKQYFERKVRDERN